jgi:hypothetical protein
VGRGSLVPHPPAVERGSGAARPKRRRRELGARPGAGLPPRPGP